MYLPRARVCDPGCSYMRAHRSGASAKSLLRSWHLKRGKTAVIVGAQWGDEGKGKIVLQLVPCGVLRTACRSVIGNGVVLDPMAFLKEVGQLREAGVTVDGNLFVSNRAQVILPYHRMIELAAENAP